MKIKFPNDFDWTFIIDDILINISRPSLHDFSSQRLILSRVSDKNTVPWIEFKINRAFHTSWESPKKIGFQIQKENVFQNELNDFT